MNIQSLFSESLSRFISWGYTQLSNAIEENPNSALASIALGTIAIVGSRYIYRNRMQSTVLDFASNQLTQAPDVRLRQNPQLAVLDLSSNQLMQAPDVSQNPHLETLNLSSNQLTQAPDVRQNPQLEVLDLASNQLTQAPDVSQNLQLRFLYLNSNQLTQAADVRQNPHLETLNLSSNQLTQAPDVRQNPQLEVLDLGSNQLTQAPDVSQNLHLETLNLSSNLLTELPDSILALPGSGSVFADNNRFSYAYVQRFQQRLQEYRIQHPRRGPYVTFSIYDADPAAVTLSLEEEINSWEREFEIAKKDQDCFQPLLRSLDSENQKTLARYLGKLRMTEDYSRGFPSKGNVILRVRNMLELAAQNEEFRNGMLALLEEGMTSCGDRVLLIFNEIEILWNFYFKPLSDEEFKDLAIRAQRYRELQKCAETECRKKGLGDAIETILYYHLKLKKVLRLPITTQDMLYPGIAGVTDKMLKKACKKIEAMTDEYLLAESGYWQTKMRKQHPKKCSEIDDKYSDLLSNAEEYFGLDDGTARKRCLEKHSDLKQILDNNPLIKNYLDAVEEISRLQRKEIAVLDTQPASSTSSLSSLQSVPDELIDNSFLNTYLDAGTVSSAPSSSLSLPFPAEEPDTDIEMEIVGNTPSSSESAASAPLNDDASMAPVNSRSSRKAAQAQRRSEPADNTRSKKRHKKP